eukprot:s3628_g5.t1
MGWAALALAAVLWRCATAGIVGISAADANCFGWWARQCRWAVGPPPEGLSAEEDSACSASGQVFPPATGASWADVLEQMTRCTTGFYEGRYVEVRLRDAEDFERHWPIDGGLPWSGREVTFGLCIPRGKCKDFAVQWLLVPLLLVYLRRGGPNFVNHEEIFRHAETLAATLSRPPGDPQLLQGTLHKERLYDLARQELEMKVDASQEVSGVICIAGHLRSFGEREVYQNLRKNVIESLRFTALRTVLISEFGASAPEEERQNPWRSWKDVASALDTVAPDVVLNFPVHVEGHPPDRLCHAKYPMSCNAQWRRLELCMEQVEIFEKSRQAPVDWVLRLRPDMLFSVPLGDIRIFDPQKLHLPMGSWTDAHDTFAIIPRHFAEVYFSTRQYGGSDYCWISPRESIRSDDCCHRLKLQLQKHHIPVKRFALLWQPWEIVDRYIVRPKTWNGSKIYGLGKMIPLLAA